MRSDDDLIGLRSPAVRARLLRIPLSSRLSVWRVLVAMACEPWSFALTGRWAGGGAVIGASPLAIAPITADPFDVLEAVPHVEVDDGAARRGAIGGGWFGWLGYGLGANLEQPPPRCPLPAPVPAFRLAYYDHVLRLDEHGQWWFEALDTPARHDAILARADDLAHLLAYPPRATVAAAPALFRLVGASRVDHVEAVRRCREQIAAGTILQANIGLRLETKWTGDLSALYARAAAQLRPAYGAMFDTPGCGIASLSPELFLRRECRDVSTGPTMGTIRRETDPQHAATALHALRGSDKDAAKHAMIVELMRRDLDRICDDGSVEVSPSPSAEAHPGVWHLVSTVRGRLRDDVDDGALLRATFPPASVTGAPKILAMRVIAELERSRRDVYTGAVGYASPVAGLELSVAIRTFEAHSDRLRLGVGGGVVADSEPTVELEECLVEARPLLRAIGSALRWDRHTPWRMARAERWLLERVPLGVHLGLDRMKLLLHELDNPQQAFRSIHVVGTNGKSSTVRMTAAILAEHGLLVGAYLSPHLRSFAERVEIAGTVIGSDELAASVERAAAATVRVDAGRAPADRITRFEALTAAAFDALASNGVDVAVIEAGLGGRLDATNVIDSNVQVLTSVALDHAELLGDTVAEIAREKLAVVRDGTMLVLGQRLPEDVQELALNAAEASDARIVRARSRPSHVPRPLGAFQERNFAIAEAAAEAFLGPLVPDAVARAAQTVRVAGRLDVLDRAPLTLVDAAHNPQGIEALIESLPAVLERAGLPSDSPLVVVVSILSDKDARGMLQRLLPRCAGLIATVTDDPRASPPRDLATLAAGLGFSSPVVEPRPLRALAQARTIAGPRGVVLVTGSISLVGELLSLRH